MNFQKIRTNEKARYAWTFISVLTAGFLQAAIMQIFMNPINLLSSGFTGVAILVEKITSTFFGFSFPVSLGMLILNIPVAILCSKSISKRFTFFSLLQVFFASFFLRVLHFEPLFEDILLNVIFFFLLFASFEGNTGPYILYTMVRIKSILAKYKEKGGKEPDMGALLKGSDREYSTSETDLMLSASRFADMIEKAAEELAPHRVCQYIYELSNAFNSFYHANSTLVEED